jgi:hypothetical protein
MCLSLSSLLSRALGLELSEENDRRLYGMTPEKLRSRGVAEECKCPRSEAKNLEDTFPSRSYW